ncbi:MAG: RNA 2',3'-cyclic phosphodiesterase [Candidatus Nanohaloarchaea archaeon]
MRYFISIDVTDESVKDSIMNFTSAIQEYGDMKPVSRENLHITLLYIGERSSSETDELQSAFINSCKGIDVSEFTCRMEGVGVFPHMNYIETVWVGAKPSGKIEKLHMNFSEVIDGEEHEEFVPHVTVARVRGIGPEDKSALQDEIERYQQEFGRFAVDRVRLKQSELGPDGPTYRDVEVYEL